MSTSSIPSSNLVWGYHNFGGPLTDFKEESIPTPTLTNPNDVLVRNLAISLNPTDNKQKSGAYGQSGTSVEAVIGGRDASGVIVQLGQNVTNFKVGDEVWYAGSNVRQGSFSQFTLVDHRIISLKPKSIDHVQAASIPLTAITVWESLFEKVKPVKGSKILITAGAGGVGSIAIQLSRYWGLEVTATVSRPESSEWVKSLGATHVLDHSKPLLDQVKNKDGNNNNNNWLGEYDYVFNCHDDSLLPQILQVIKPRGEIIMILPFSTENSTNEVLRNIFYKSITVHWELMFARPMYGFDENKQSYLLSEVAKLIDNGSIKSTTNKVFEWDQFPQAFQLLVSGRTIGKTVVKVKQ